MSVLEVKEERGFLFLTLNRPEKHNAINVELMEEITKTLSYYKDNKEKLSNLKALVLTGNGKSFCAGADLNWMKSMVSFSFEENKADSLKLFNMFSSLYDFPLPIVTYAHGNVFGGGLGFLGASDYVIAEKNTKFCFSEVKLGLIPAVISSFILTKSSSSFTRALMTSGEVFTSSTAFHMGLIQKVDKSVEGVNALQDTLKNYYQNSSEALIQCKALLKKQESLNPHSFKVDCITAISQLRSSDEAQTRMNNFLSKKASKS